MLFFRFFRIILPFGLMSIQGGVLKGRTLAITLTDSWKYATYDNMTFFSQFQDKKDFFSGLLIVHLRH